MNLSIIDGDSIIWVVAYHNKENGTTQSVCEGVSNFVQNILNGTSADAYIGFLGGEKDTFRHKQATILPYKGNRSETPEFVKKWRPVIKNYLVEVHGFTIVEGIEADDACAIAHTKNYEGYTTILCSPDKDMKQVPGLNYNYRIHEMIDITRDEAEKLLWIQMLTGDSTDNIQGIPRIGPVKAKKILNNPNTMLMDTMDAYIKKFGYKKGKFNFHENLMLIYMLRTEPKGFVLPSPIKIETLLDL